MATIPNAPATIIISTRMTSATAPAGVWEGEGVKHGSKSNDKGAQNACQSAVRITNKYVRFLHHKISDDMAVPLTT